MNYWRRIMKKTIRWLVIEESGQGMVEYSLLLALVVIVIIGAVTIVGESTYNLYNETISKMP
jgi:pilus assembly protein Flp/PilA